MRGRLTATVLGGALLAGLLAGTTSVGDPYDAKILPAETEAAARRIEEQIIAPCCFRQPVSVHHSEAADAMKRDIRRLLAEGRSEDEVVAALVAVYGERVLAAPRAGGFNLLAYLVPVLGLAFGVVALGIVLRTRRGGPADARPGARVPGAEAAPGEEWRALLREDLRRFEERQG